MDLTLIHPKLVHLPMALAVLMPLLATGLLLSWWRGWLPGRVWWVAVVGQVLLVATGYLALETGEADEERVERVVAEEHIETHEHAAQEFMLAAAIGLALFLAAGLVRRERPAQALALGALLATLVVLVLGFRVGEAGGALVYKYGATRAFEAAPDQAPPPLPRGRGEEHED